MLYLFYNNFLKRKEQGEKNLMENSKHTSGAFFLSNLFSWLLVQYPPLPRQPWNFIGNLTPQNTAETSCSACELSPPWARRLDLGDSLRSGQG